MGRTILRYSKSFKIRIIKEIEEEGKGIEEIRKKYDIKGSETIQMWLRKYGKNELLNKVVRVEMPEEKDRIKTLEKEKQELERALAKLTIQNQVYESIFEIYAEDSGYDLKKNYGIKELEEHIKKERLKGTKKD